MTKNPSSAQAIDKERALDQQYSKRQLVQALDYPGSTMANMEKHWDNLVYITDMRVRARLSGWFPLKGE